MRSTMLATALLIGGSSIVNAQGEFNLDSKSQAEVGFFSDSKPIEPAPLIGDRFEVQNQEPPSFAPSQEQNNFVSKPGNTTNAAPTWAAPQPVMGINSAIKPQSRLAQPTNVSPEMNVSQNANFGAGYIPGVAQWAPGGPSAPRSLLAYVQCNTNDCLWAGYSQKQGYRHTSGSCSCQCMATQHFGHVCRAPGCGLGNCGSCSQAGVAPSFETPVTAPNAAPCASCMSQTSPNAFQSDVNSQAKAPAPDGKVAQFWPMPSLFGSKSDKPANASKTSSSNHELPMTFR